MGINLALGKGLCWIKECGWKLAGSEPPEPPVLSDYCVQWGHTPGSSFWACLGSVEINGVFDQGAICGGTFEIADYMEAGNTFAYDAATASTPQGSYVQVIRPAANAPLTDLGYYLYEFPPGNPSGPYTIDIEDSNCYVQCWEATFDVDGVGLSGFTAVVIQDPDRGVDLFNLPPTMVAFNDPTAEAEYLNQLIVRALVEPTATVSVTVNSPTNVTLTICTIMNLYSGSYGDDTITKGTFNFTLV